MKHLFTAALAAGAISATSALAQQPAGGVQARCEALAAKNQIAKPDRPAALEACTAAQAAAPGDARLLLLKGKALFWSEKDAEALAAFTAAAERGSAEALHEIGVIHHWGYGVAEDPGKAIGFYQRALTAGYMPAAVTLGTTFRDGAGVPKDLRAAAAHFRRAADAGLPAGEVSLGHLYEYGLGVRADLTRAVALYRSAADKGHSGAQFNMGVLSGAGRGMRKDLAEAARWYRLAVDGGNANAMFNLAIAHQQGLGVPKDAAAAEALLRKAVEAGDEVDAPNSLAYLYARENRNVLEAAKLAEGALKAAPDNAAVLDTVALIRMRQNRLTEAALLMRKSVALEPTPIHHMRLGDIYAAMGLKADAKAQWRLALTAKEKPGAEVEVTAEELRRKLASN
jgi:TPR repeat protein